MTLDDHLTQDQPGASEEKDRSTISNYILLLINLLCKVGNSKILRILCQRPPDVISYYSWYLQLIATAASSVQRIQYSKCKWGSRNWTFLKNGLQS